MLRTGENLPGKYLVSEQFHNLINNIFYNSVEKRRQGDRLKCNVCGENFRERHHLTRHMTAHQVHSFLKVKLIDHGTKFKAKILDDKIDFVSGQK